MATHDPPLAIETTEKAKNVEKAKCVDDPLTIFEPKKYYLMEIRMFRRVGTFPWATTYEILGTFDAKCEHSGASHVWLKVLEAVGEFKTDGLGEDVRVRNLSIYKDGGYILDCDTTEATDMRMFRSAKRFEARVPSFMRSDERGFFVLSYQDEYVNVSISGRETNWVPRMSDGLWEWFRRFRKFFS